MAASMKMGDEIRLNILSALLKQGSVSPNLRQLQKYTGYHKATIKSSLDFLSKLLEEVKKDHNLYFLSGIIGSGNWNLLARHIYKDIESYHEGVNKKYF